MELDDHRFPKFPVQERSERMVKNTPPLSSKQSSQVILIQFLCISSFGSVRGSGFGPREDFSPFLQSRQDALPLPCRDPPAALGGCQGSAHPGHTVRACLLRPGGLESLSCPQQNPPRTPCHLAPCHPPFPCQCPALASAFVAVKEQVDGRQITRNSQSVVAACS